MMNVLEQVHQMVWGPWTLVIFLGVGIFFTLKCHFFQIRGFLFWWSRTAGRLISGEASRKEDGTGRARRPVLDVGISPDRHDNRLCRDHVGNQVPVQG